MSGGRRRRGRTAAHALDRTVVTLGRTGGLDLLLRQDSTRQGLIARNFGARHRYVVRQGRLNGE